MRERLYNDYLMPNRYKEYEELLINFLEHGYQFICIKDYEKMNNSNQKNIIIRHDIDSDVKIARKMFEIEKKLGIQSTYYFRLCTMNKKLINEIVSFGSEVGYHYEELAQFCKDNKQIDSDFAKSHIEEIKKSLVKNINIIEQKNDIKLYSISSHGDFINRRINLTNQFIYQDDLKAKLDLIEAYEIEQYLDYRTADNMYPTFWKENPLTAIEENKQKVLILIHPRWWNRAPLERFRLDFGRILEEIRFK